MCLFKIYASATSKQAHTYTCTFQLPLVWDSLTQCSSH